MLNELYLEKPIKIIRYNFCTTYIFILSVTLFSCCRQQNVKRICLDKTNKITNTVLCRLHFYLLSYAITGHHLLCHHLFFVMPSLAARWRRCVRKPSRSLRLDCAFIYFFTYFCFLFLHTATLTCFRSLYPQIHPGHSRFFGTWRRTMATGDGSRNTAENALGFATD